MFRLIIIGGGIDDWNEEWVADFDSISEIQEMLVQGGFNIAWDGYHFVLNGIKTNPEKIMKM